MGEIISALYLLFYLMLHSVQSQNWTHHTVLDVEGRYHLYWKPPADKSGNSKIIFKVELEARGYFGLGLSPNGGMPGSDIVTGWIKDDEVYFQDRHAISFSLPEKDSQQDYELLTAYENDTFTVFEFWRRLETCDENDTVIDESTMRVIYAYSEEDPLSDDPFYHHENRGVKSVLFLRDNIKGNSDLNYTSLLTWDLTSPGVDISYSDTLYWCKIYRTPQVTEKHHIVQVSPLIEEGHERFVHHTAIYECIGGTDEEYERFLDDSGHECWLPNMPDEMHKCIGFTVTWAVGGEDMVFPEHVGMPIEPAPGKYYMFEIHYDNPQVQSGIIDHSGMRFYYTSKLREFDAETFMVGSPFLPRAFIPPHQKEYLLVAHSSPECVTSRFPENGVKALAVLPHSHGMGREIKIRHFRGKKELPPLAHDKNYDFNYQDFRFYMKEVDILPNDQITVECLYDSSKKNNVTMGGNSGTEDEMCLCFIIYYPLSNIYFSFSGPSFSNINKALGTNVTNETDLSHVLQNFDWASADIDTIQNSMMYSEHESLCQYGEYPEEGVSPLVTYPSDIIPYKPESTCNDNM